jgi:Peptidase A4 family
VAVPKRNTKFKSVTATYNVANLNCAESTPGPDGSWYSAWVGLDGWTNGTVETGDGITMISQSSSDTLAEAGRLIGGEAFVETWLNPL